MNKVQFLAELRRSLGSTSDAEKQEILYDYEEHFRMGLAEGKTEEAIAQSLGNPRVIGNSYRIDAMLEKPDGGGVTFTSILRAVFASISLTFLNLVFVLGPFCGLVGVIFALWCVVFALTVSGLAVGISFALPFDTQVISTAWLDIVFKLTAGIGIASLGLLFGVGMTKVTQWFFLGVAAYVKFNARIIRGER